MERPSLSIGVPPRNCTGMGVFPRFPFNLSNLLLFGGNFLSSDFGAFLGSGFEFAFEGPCLSVAAPLGFGISSHITAGNSRMASTYVSKGSSP